MLVSEKLAIAAHLHVLLRRKTGRVTDTEWLAGNREYALEIIRFSRAKAAEDGHPDLAEWADKLERAMLEGKPAGKQPLAQSAMQMVRERHAVPPQGQAAVAAPAPASEPSASGFGQSVFGESGFADSTMVGPDRVRKPRDPNAPRYVGGIR
ncbi:hypothetical protein [uncultured Ramlibacter sp.]|uniref:hypothetical protein n=1 Tax=uncultured Ramlibacter sp. TaxID=260755 RepID=UPI00345B583F